MFKYNRTALSEMTLRAAPKTARVTKSSMNARRSNPLDILTTGTPKPTGYFNNRQTCHNGSFSATQ